MSALLERIERTISAIGHQRAAKDLGVTMATLRYWKKGETKIPIDKLYHLALIAHTDPMWLIMGQSGNSGAVPPIVPPELPIMPHDSSADALDPLLMGIIKGVLDSLQKQGLVITDANKLANVISMAYDVAQQRRRAGTHTNLGLDIKSLERTLKIIAD